MSGVDRVLLNWGEVRIIWVGLASWQQEGHPGVSAGGI